MRSGTMLVLGLLLVSTAIPHEAQARDLLGSMVGALTSPIRGVLGPGRHHYRSRAHHRRIVRSPRSRPAAIVAAPVAAGVAIATAATTAATEPKITGITGTTGSAPSDGPQSALPPAPIARLGAVGPLAWPGSFEDVIGYTLWPKQYGTRLGAHGIGDVLSTAFAPSATIAARTKQARADSTADAAPACRSVELTANDWPIAEIGSTVELNDTQRAALDKLRTAMNGAIASIKSNCRDTADLGPVQRLQAMQTALWAVHDAAQQMRAPLAAFYATLNDEQKQRFTAPERASGARGASQSPNRGDIARMCDLPASTDAPIRQIEQAVRPTAAQRKSLEELQRKAGEMGQFLLASCLAPVPDTPTQRLDAAADRLTAMVFAISNVNIALNDFTSRLSNDQKSKLDSVAR